MKKILIFLILAIIIISVSIGYRSITLGEGLLDVKGGFIRENNVIWSKSPSMSLSINNNSILPKKNRDYSIKHKKR